MSLTSVLIVTRKCNEMVVLRRGNQIFLTCGAFVGMEAAHLRSIFILNLLEQSIRSTVLGVFRFSLSRASSHFLIRTSINSCTHNIDELNIKYVSYVFGSSNNGNTSNVGTRWRTPTFRAALASDRKISPLEVGLSKPPMPVVAGAPMGTGAII
jgi:hypothetical protein